MTLDDYSGFDGKFIYVASPIFSDGERDWIEKVVWRLASDVSIEFADAKGFQRLDANKNFYVPHRDGAESQERLGLGSPHNRKDIFDTDIYWLNKCAIMIALLDGPIVDDGTAFEIGYFYAKDKTIFGLLTDFRAYQKGMTAVIAVSEINRLNFMIWNSVDIASNIADLTEKLKYHLQ